MLGKEDRDFYNIKLQSIHEIVIKKVEHIDILEESFHSETTF